MTTITITIDNEMEVYLAEELFYTVDMPRMVQEGRDVPKWNAVKAAYRGHAKQILRAIKQAQRKRERADAQ